MEQKDYRIFSIETNEGTKNLILKGGQLQSLKEEVFIGNSKLVLLDRGDYEEYQKSEDFEDTDLIDWLEENEKEYKDWCEEYVSKEELEEAEENEENILIDTEYGEQSSDGYEYELVYNYWDGHNWKALEVVNPINSEVTDNYPGLEHVSSYRGDYILRENGELHWKEYRTGRYEIYKDNDLNFYLVDVSYYQENVLDYIEPITVEELQERFLLEVEGV